MLLKFTLLLWTVSRHYTLVQVLITIHLDHCNNFLFCLPALLPYPPYVSQSFLPWHADLHTSSHDSELCSGLAVPPAFSLYRSPSLCSPTPSHAYSHTWCSNSPQNTFSLLKLLSLGPPTSYGEPLLFLSQSTSLRNFSKWSITIQTSLKRYFRPKGNHCLTCKRCRDMSNSQRIASQQPVLRPEPAICC